MLLLVGETSHLSVSKAKESDLTMKYARIIAAFLAFATSVIATTASAQVYSIQAGDLLRVEVLEDSTINREVLVAPDGYITVPLGGNIRVAGASLPEAERRVRSALESNFATPPTVVVSLLQLRDVPAPAPDPDNIFVIGEVNNPGAIAIEDGITLLQTLALAGGVTDFAAVKRIQLRRVENGTERVYRLNYQSVLDGVSNVGRAEMRAGDVIVVPARRLFE